MARHMILSYKYRVNPNRAQTVALEEMLADFCSLYNAGLQQRMEAYRRQGKSLRYQDQANELKTVRTELPEIAHWSFSAEQQVLRRLDKAFKAFFARGRGFPRFRASTRFHAAEFRVGDGLTLRRGGHLGLVGVPGEIRVSWHRELPSKPASAILTRQNGKWYVVFHVEVTPATEHVSHESVGVDLGLTSLVALSNGETIQRPNWTKRAAKRLRRRQRALARCERGSKTRSKRKTLLAKYQAHVANKRRDHLHNLSNDLVNRFGRIAVEDLNIKGLAGGILAKHVHDASWAILIFMLDYKAAIAGGELIKVNPRGTSQTCPECGLIVAKTLKERTHSCECGCVLDRDVAAAMVVHFRAFGFGPGSGLGARSGTSGSKLAPEAAQF
jgi:putative transposase